MKIEIDFNECHEILKKAVEEGRYELFEHEVYEFLAAAGIEGRFGNLVPPQGAPDWGFVDRLGTSRVVLKVVSPAVIHKSDIGGVRIVEADAVKVEAAFKEMLIEMPVRFRREVEAGKILHDNYRNLDGKQIEKQFLKDLCGILVCNYVTADHEGFGGEFFMGLNWSREFGPIVISNVGGVDTELMADAFKPGKGFVLASPGLTSPDRFMQLFSDTIIAKKMTGRVRMQGRLIEDDEIMKIYETYRSLARYFGPEGAAEFKLDEFEINPFIISKGRLVPADALCRFSLKGDTPPSRPLQKITKLLKPETIGIIGVSAGSMNMGRVILRNIIEFGYPKEQLYIVKPGSDEIDGVRCVPDIKDLPEKMDMTVVSINAAQVPELMEKFERMQKTESVVLITGGMAEKSGGESIEQKIREIVRRSRRKEGEGFVVNGGNCMGIRSLIGNYNTIFSPKSKMPEPSGSEGKTVLVSQSGAFMLGRITKLSGLNPLLSISSGNQVDVTVSDYLEFCLETPQAKILALYVEGFKEVDGYRFARLTEQAVKKGKTVIVYKAGRTSEGRKATSGHTASIAGDYKVCKAVLKESGALIAEDFDEFRGLMRLADYLDGKEIKGMNLAALSNAGYECVAMADNVKGEDYAFNLLDFKPATENSIRRAFSKLKIDAIVDMRNPLDITPMADDKVYAEIVSSMLQDNDIHALLVGLVPFSPMTATAPSNDKPELLYTAEHSIMQTLPHIARNFDKPVVAVVDAGKIYDPAVEYLESQNIVTLRSADTAMKLLGKYMTNRLKRS